jgi:hypothetical protein
MLALVGLVAYGAVRPTSPDPLDDVRARETGFYINKANQPLKFDGIVVGDSRALRGVSTDAMRSDLGNIRVFNFAINSCGLGREIYVEAEELLDPTSPNQFIILAPTSLTFQPWKRENAMFHEYRQKARDQVWTYQHMPFLAQFMQPVSPSVYLRKAFHIVPDKRLEQEFHADGWIATRQIPVDDLSDLSILHKSLAGNVIDPLLVKEFMAQTREWTARDIRVFAFYPPAHPERTALEDSVLGFNRQEFSEEFTLAGGKWIEIDGTGLQTYDGSHLNADSATRMSRILAKHVKARW